MLAKRKIQPIFGFMTTLDIMGYSSEQFYTIPFLVYSRALRMYQLEPNKEINKKMLGQIEETCVKMLEFSEVFREETIEKVVKFAYQPPNEPSRTQDIIRSLEVLSTQFLCLLKIGNLSKLTK